jgi:hypothetical protein
VLYALFVDGLVEELRSRGLGVVVGGVWVGVALYADDTVLLATNKEELQKMMEVVDIYSQRWRFKVNASKTKVMVCGEKKVERVVAKAQRTWRMAGASVEEVEVFKYLGVELRVDGKWKAVAERLSSKGMAVAGLLLGQGGVCCGMGMGMKRRLWQALGLPVLSYGTEVWGVGKTVAKQLEKVQKFVGQQVLGCGKMASEFLIRGELGWMSLAGRRDETKLRFLGRLVTMKEKRVVRQVFAVRSRDAQTSRGKGKGWCSKVEELLEKYELVAKFQALVVRGVKGIPAWQHAVQEAVWEKEEAAWKEGVAAREKLERYGRVKTELFLEPFVNSSAAERRSAALKVRLRGGRSSLEVERGKYVGLERCKRVCQICNSGKVEDEEHFLLVCEALEGPRDSMWWALEDKVLACGEEGRRAWDRIGGLSNTELVDLFLSGWRSEWSDEVWWVVESATRHGMWCLWKARQAALAKLALDPVHLTA